jgi:hypothetical protein
MKYSYSFENKVFSVVGIADGGVLEIRRGYVTFPRGGAATPERWASLDEWRATWPVGAVAVDAAVANQPKPRTTASSSNVSTDPLLNLFHKHEIRPNLTFGPHHCAEKNAHCTIRVYTGYLKAYQADPVKNALMIRGAQYQIDVAKKMLSRCKRYKEGTYDFPARIVGPPRIHVIKDGAVFPLAYHAKRGLVRVLVYDATSGKHKFISPAEFGIDATSQFLLRDPDSSIMSPITP